MSVFDNQFVLGRWYVLVACAKCKVKQVLFPDLSDGQAKLHAAYGWTCPLCDHHAYYDSGDLERYQHLVKPEP